MQTMCVAKNFLNMVISQNTEDQFIRDLNILAHNVANNLLNRVVLTNHIQFMKESNIFAYNVAKIFSTGTSCRTQKRS